METINDIVREMRKRFEPYAKSDSNDARYVAYLGYAEFADRLEAAWEREAKAIATENAVLPAVCITKPFGNAVKMHEVVYGIKNTANSALTALSIGNDMSSFLWDIIRKCEAALSAPPRNCDLYEKEDEASKEFIVWYNTVYDLYGDKWGEVSSCDLKHNIDDILHRYIDWLFAEAKGEVK